MSSEDRTEPATARRLQKARDDGDVAVSRELSMLCSLAGGTMAIAAQFAADPSGPARWLQAGLQAGLQGGVIWYNAIWAVLPAWAGAAGGFAAATLLQTGFLLRPQAVQPDFSRIGILRGVKRLLGPDAAAQAVRALAKLAVLVAAIFLAAGRLRPILAASASLPPAQFYRELVGQGTQLLTGVLVAQAAIAGADLLWVRMRHARRLRMSRQELRDEHRDSEGNPQVKQRLRQVARSRARRRMMAAVPKAAVVITNPTHFAVALAYERGARGAPRLVAKGADEIAATIRETARQHHVPIIANPPLARALYRIEIDTEIPAEHFKAVAEIIAYLWRMRARAGRN